MIKKNKQIVRQTNGFLKNLTKSCPNIFRVLNKNFVDIKTFDGLLKTRKNSSKKIFSKKVFTNLKMCGILKSLEGRMYDDNRYIS